MQEAQFTCIASMEDHHWWFLARRRIVREILSHILPPHQQHTLVDIGCGSGGTIASLSPPYICIGIDPSHYAVTLAKERYPDIQFLQGEISSILHTLPKPVACVLLMDVLEHVQNDAHLLEQIVQALSPGEYLLITVPADMSLFGPHDESAGHLRRYSVSALQSLWASLPVCTLLLSPFNTYLSPGIRFLRFLKKKCGGSWGGAGTDFFLPPLPLNMLLEWTFAYEARRILGVLHGTQKAFSRGISIIALLQRLPSQDVLV